jgi:ABC-2 type transport system permease protein
VTRRLRPYAAVVNARFRVLLQYRAAALAGLWTQLFFGLVLIMVYEAFYASSTEAAPMTFGQIVSYVWLGQALLAMLPWNVDAEVRAMVRSGAVAYELCRPLDLYTFWYARALAWRTAPTVLRAVPMCIIASIGLPLVGLDEWQLVPPASLASGAAFAIALAGTLLLGCAISTFINISLLWTISGEGAVVLLTALVAFLSGMIVPLPLFPDWSQPVLRVLPFAGLVDFPFRIFTGHIAPGDAGWVVLHQVAWTLAFVAAGRWLLARGLSRVVVQGG